MIPTLMFIPSSALKAPLTSPNPPTAKGSGDGNQVATTAVPFMIPQDARGLMQIPHEWLGGDKHAIFAGYYSLLPPNASLPTEGATDDQSTDGATQLQRYYSIALQRDNNVTIAPPPTTNTTTTTATTTSKSKSKPKHTKTNQKKEHGTKSKEGHKLLKTSSKSLDNKPTTEKQKSKEKLTTTTTTTSTAAAAATNNAESVRRRDIFWEDMFAQLKAFKDAHGHCMVPQKHPHLGGWVKRQRERRKKRRLNESRIAALDEIGFIWQIRGHAKGEGSDDDEDGDDDDDEDDDNARKQSVKFSLDELASTAARALSKKPKKSSSEPTRKRQSQHRKEKKKSSKKKDQFDSPEPPKRKPKTTHEGHASGVKASLSSLSLLSPLPTPLSSLPTTHTTLSNNLSMPAGSSVNTSSLSSPFASTSRLEDAAKHHTSSPASYTSSASPSPNPSAMTHMPPLHSSTISMRPPSDEKSPASQQQTNPLRSSLQLPLPHEPSNLRLQSQLFSQTTPPPFTDAPTTESEYPPSLTEGLSGGRVLLDYVKTEPKLPTTSPDMMTQPEDFHIYDWLSIEESSHHSWI